jgi:hypothetical protein
MAVNVTCVPTGKLALHVVPQLMPLGLLVTVPVPVPASCTVKVTGAGLKVAVTVAADVSVIVHVLAPVQTPDQPANVEVTFGVAVSVTELPPGKLAVHVVPQLMPEGLLMTVPAPLPASFTVSCTGGAAVLKVAVTDVAALTVTMQVPVPVHAPDHPANVDPELAVAANVTEVPVAKLAVHVVPQLMPAGLLVTVPVPDPAFVTVSGNCVGAAVLNVAVTVVAAVGVTVHVPVPVQPPVHPANVEPAAGIAVNVTEVPLVKLAVHVVPQLMPEGVLVTVPVPVPAVCTVTATVAAVEVLKVAVTEALAAKTIAQAPVPVQAPDHPTNVEPVAGVAVSETAAPLLKLVLHVCPQLMPPGVLVTTPAPLPADCTVSW